MKNIKIVNETVENDDGDTITRFYFTTDEENAPKSRSVEIRPLAIYNKLINMSQNEEGHWNTEGESILFRDVFKKGGGHDPIADSLGTNALGRKFGQELAKLSPAEQKKNKDSAKWYTFIFGLFSFDGKEPVLGNIRLTGSQGLDWDPKKALTRDLHNNLVKFTVKPNNEGMRKFVFTFESAKSAATDVDDSIQAVEDFVAEHNDNVVGAND